MTVSPDGGRLFVASFDDTTINDYSIGASHALTLLDQITVPAGLLPSIVAYTPAAATTPQQAPGSHVRVGATPSRVQPRRHPRAPLPAQRLARRLNGR